MKKHYYTDAIVEICNHKHLTVDEIFSEISQKFSESGKSSIYRNVEDLVKKGQLTKLVGIGKKAIFEKTQNAHAHFICKNSGKILDIDLEDLNLGNLKNKYSISEIETLDIKIYGILDTQNSVSSQKILKTS